MLNFLVIYSVFTKFQATDKFNWGLYSCAVLPKQDLGKKNCSVQNMHWYIYIL